MADALQRLDVFTPDQAKGKKLPVLLFVHGGGFTRGEARRLLSRQYHRVGG